MDLVQFLYCVMSYYLNGNKLEREATPVINKILETSFCVSIPYIDTVLKAMEKGQPVDYVSLATSLQVFLKEYVKHPKAKVSFAKTLNLFAKWFKTGSDSSYRLLVKTTALCESPYIRGFISEEKFDQATVKKQLIKTSKSLGFGGKPLDADQKKLAKAKDPEGYKEYTKLARQHGLAWKQELSEYVRQSGGKTLAYKDVVAHLKSMGIDHTMPTGFTGNVDADGNWYTKDGNLINGVPNASMFPSVIMNKSGEGDYVFQAVRSNGELANYFYTKEQQQKNAKEKFQFTSGFIKKLPGYRMKWLANIKRPFDYSSITGIASVVIELMYLSSQRVGTKVGGNEKGNGFGMSSILCKHVTARPNGEILISYSGKDGVPFKFVLDPGTPKDKVICAVMKDLIKDKKPSEPVFTRDLKNGHYRLVSSGSITSYFSSICGGANIHKLRTAAGTGLFDEITKGYFAKLGDRKITMPTAIELVKKAAMIVGKKLGHITRDAKTGAMKVAPGTSLKNYIDLEMQVAFFAHFNLPPPPYLEKFLETEKTITSAVDDETDKDDTATEDVPVVDDTKSTPVMEKQIEEVDDEDEDNRLLGNEEAMRDPVVLELVRSAERFLAGESQRMMV